MDKLNYSRVNSLCKKEGLSLLSPLSPSHKQPRTDSCVFSNTLPRFSKRPTIKMDSECEVSESQQEFRFKGFHLRTEPSPHNFFQFRNKRMRTQSCDYFNILPDEMILKVFKWLPKQSLGRVALTCRRLQRLAEDETLWRRMDLQGQILNSTHLAVVLSRQPVYLRLARAQIRDPEKIPLGIQASQLIYLDLSVATVNPETLTLLLSLCSSLVKLSLEHLAVPKSATEAMQVFSSTLDSLNVTMCYEINATSFAALLKKSKHLKHLNMGWLVQDWTSDELLGVISSFSSNLEQLNLAGFREGLIDKHVENVVSCCPGLIDLDISDCQDIQMAVESVSTLSYLQHLALSRCYSLQAASYGLLGGMRSLRYLEVFSLFKESALKTLKSALPGVEINQFYFSAVARPTVGVKRRSIWSVRVRD